MSSVLPLRSTFSSSFIFLLCSHYEQDVNRIGLDLFGPAASTDSGYENSLMRWLLYFNPAARLGEFIAELTAAHVYLVTRQRSAALGTAAASAMTLIAIALTVGLHLWVYGVIRARQFIHRPYRVAALRTASRRHRVSDRPLRNGVVTYPVAAAAGASGRSELLDLYAVKSFRPASGGSACRARILQSAGLPGLAPSFSLPLVVLSYADVRTFSKDAYRAAVFRRHWNRKLVTETAVIIAALIVFLVCYEGSLVGGAMTSSPLARVCQRADRLMLDW
jgi:hypothetical protein